MKRNYVIVISGVFIGAIGGYAYYYFVGCSTGNCPITSNPWISSAYGSAMGYFASGLVKKKEL